MRTLFKDCRILDPSQDLDIFGSVLVEDGQVFEIGPEVDDNNVDEIYNCNGLWLTPGLVDMHVHLREPGQEKRETIRTGTQAAAAGGFTTICCMPNTNPPLDNAAIIDFILDKAASPEAGGIFVAPVGALTHKNLGENVSDLSSLKKAGIVAASDNGNPIQNSLVMARAMEFCHQLDLPVMAHCEDTSLSAGTSMNDGAMAAMLGLKGMPRSAEEIMIMRNCVLAMNSGCDLHILRVSTWGGVEMVRQFKHLGAPVTCEVCPHHFFFTDEAVGEFNPNFKTTPPLRTEVDIDIILQALQDGTIDCIASDHSPYAPFEVEVPFDQAPFGMAGLESTLGATLTALTQKGILSPLETIRRLSTRPAEILRLDAGTLRPGVTPVAQITLIDPHVEWTFDVHRTFSKGKNSPFHGIQFQGKAVLTYCGNEVYRDPHFSNERHQIALA